ncbi:MAG: PolC-type DNA polymerase III [Metamycoplasmataceae bacterium]
MENSFLNFCKEIDWEIPSYLEKSIITSASLDKNESFIVNISFICYPEIKDLELFFKKAKKLFLDKITFNMSFGKDNLNKEIIYKYLCFFAKKNFKLSFDDYVLFSNINLILDEKKIIIKCFEEKINLFWEKNYDKISKILIEIGLDDFKLEIINFLSKTIEQEKELHIEKEKKIKDFLLNKKSNTEPLKVNTVKKQYKNNSLFISKISEIYESFDPLNMIEGEVISKEIFVTKTGITIFDFLVTDFTEAIHCKFFSKDSQSEKEMNNINIGSLYKIIGKKNSDLRGVPFITIRTIEKKEETDLIQNIIDDAEERRVEICLRTNMTSMDGFKTPTEFIEHAKILKHTSIGIADKNSVQSFPEFYFKSKKENIKPIYGVTLNVIDKNNGIIFNKKDGEIAKEKFVVFDLETTGLSPIFDNIIQFGACLVNNGRVIDQLSFFIKTDRPLSETTKALTGIKEEDLANGLDEKEGLIKFLDFCKDYTLVAHNAKFDIGFIKEKIYKYNLKQFENQWIDTMSLSYFLFSSTSYRLEKIAKKSGVEYNSLVAHKADYDAKVLAQVFIKLMSLLKIKKVETFSELENLQEKIFFSKKRGHEMTFYAKNQNGLKKLFKLVSKAHIEGLFGTEPKLFIEEIQKDNDLLIGCVGISSKIIEHIFTGTTEDIKNTIDLCDFISIPYLSLFKYKFDKDELNKEDFTSITKKIIYEAKEKGKLVIGTGDVRYNKEFESSFHEVYINSKSLQGRRHYLYNEKNINSSYPKQLFLNTKQMLKEYDFLNSKELAYEIVVKNSQKFSFLIDDNIVIVKNELYSPDFDNSKEKLPNLVYENAYKKFGKPLNNFIEQRIKRELEPIIKYGFSDVYWISYKLVKKSLDDGYLVGSRGSVGSSIVATLLNITEVNPLPPYYFCNQCKDTIFVNWKKENVGSGYDLENKNCNKCNVPYERDGQNIPFETFLGFNADKVPDIDLNFSGVYQPIIHQEVQNLFGENNCFRAGTISTIAPKTAFSLVRDWNNSKEEKKSLAYVDMVANKISGSKRTTGQHPGGIIIVPSKFDIEEFTPINYPSNDESKKWKTTHFDFHSIHDNLLKLDLLGHDDPTAIKLLEELTNTNAKEIPFKDDLVLSLFTSNKELKLKHKKYYSEETGAMGIPEFGTNFVRKMLTIAKPKSFADLISVSGLSHGTGVWQGNAEYLISKKGLTIKDVISCRDDIMTFLISCGVDPLKSFQIMEKVRKGIKLTTDESQLLVLNNVPKWYIESLDLIQYLFPKAHATAYVMMAWRIAWYKLYYPLEYYATYFSTRADFFDIKTMMGTEEEIFNKLNEIKLGSKEKTITPKEEKLIPILEIVLEMLARGIVFENICLKKSCAFNWKINKEKNSIIPPFISIDGLGEAAASSIIKAREEKEFYSIKELTERTLLNKTNIEKLKDLGVLSSLNETNQTKLF